MAITSAQRKHESMMTSTDDFAVQNMIDAYPLFKDECEEDELAEKTVKFFYK